MAQSDPSSQVPASSLDNTAQPQSLWKRLINLGRDRENGASSTPAAPASEQEQGSVLGDGPRPGLIRRVSRKVVPGLPRAQTFKRQQSELRVKLEPVQPTPAERRAVSMDRRLHPTISQTSSNPRTSAPDFLTHSFSADGSVASAPSGPSSPVAMEKESMLDSIGELQGPGPTEIEPPHEMPHVPQVPDCVSNIDVHSITTSQYESMIHDELERIWILNLSMHFRDKSRREKFFVTYRENNTQWRRVTISLDYRNAPPGSLEMELVSTKFQRDKSAKIYEAIRESLADIQFYDTVTNLKLQTTEGRLHVHVVEDANEIIHYPSVQLIQHMRCRRVREKDLQFESHMSGFVYKVTVNDEVLIKKEIPGPDTVDEFLYEINALNRLRTAKNVIQFFGVVVDDEDKYVKGLLISFAEQGALIDVIYDHNHSLPWSTREKWARQIVGGLSEIHESGFVQGDFTLSNIVIDDNDDAKIIDINRRGCPVGWEPPEATPLIESNQRISMYIGVKSDLYQLGMVLWALATQEDEPEAHGRPLHLGPDVRVPSWYRRVVEICLSEEPRHRMHALHLLSLFPDPEIDSPYSHPNLPTISVDDGYSPKDYFASASPVNPDPQIRTVQPPHDWSYLTWGHSYPANAIADDPYYYPTRGRSPPSPLPSNHDGFDPRYGRVKPSWSDHYNDTFTAPSVSDVLPDGEEDQETPEAGKRSITPKTSKESAVGLGSRSEEATEEREEQNEGSEGELEPSQGEQVNLEEVGLSEDSRVVGDFIKDLTPEQRDAVENLIQQAKDARPVALEHSELVEDYDMEEKEVKISVADTNQGETAPFEGTAEIGKGICGENHEEIAFNDAAGMLIEPDASEQIALATQEPQSAALTDECSDVLRGIPVPEIVGFAGTDAIELAMQETPLTRPASSGSKKSDRAPAAGPPELTGIGSAHELSSEQRQINIQEEDLGMGAILGNDVTGIRPTTDDAKE
ncbi:hypothetical protein GQ53DRAFT_825125 [Thozetella sp. PMI_491]|nr:hypothetical protein GQ53DRAFT_825125 [Thozetella sp. PMI_491]